MTIPPMNSTIRARGCTRTCLTQAQRRKKRRFVVCVISTATQLASGVPGTRDCRVVRPCRDRHTTNARTHFAASRLCVKPVRVGLFISRQDTMTQRTTVCNIWCLQAARPKSGVPGKRCYRVVRPCRDRHTTNAKTHFAAWRLCVRHVRVGLFISRQDTKTQRKKGGVLVAFSFCRGAPREPLSISFRIASGMGMFFGCSLLICRLPPSSRTSARTSSSASDEIGEWCRITPTAAWLAHAVTGT